MRTRKSLPVTELIPIHEGSARRFIVKRNGVHCGFIEKLPDTLTDKLPWKAFRPRFNPGAAPSYGEYLGAFYKGQSAAVFALIAAATA